MRRCRRVVFGLGVGLEERLAQVNEIRHRVSAAAARGPPAWTAGMGTMRVTLPEGCTPRGVPPPRARSRCARLDGQRSRGRVRGGIGVCFGFWGRARCVCATRRAPGAAAALRGGASDSRALFHLVAVVLLASYCRRSRLSTADCSSSSSSKTSSRWWRRPWFWGVGSWDKGEANIFGRAKLELVFLNASSACRAKRGCALAHSCGQSRSTASHKCSSSSSRRAAASSCRGAVGARPSATCTCTKAAALPPMVQADGTRFGLPKGPVRPPSSDALWEWYSSTGAARSGPVLGRRVGQRGLPRPARARDARRPVARQARRRAGLWARRLRRRCSAQRSHVGRVCGSRTGSSALRHGHRPAKRVRRRDCAPGDLRGRRWRVFNA